MFSVNTSVILYVFVIYIVYVVKVLFLDLKKNPETQ